MPWIAIAVGCLLAGIVAIQRGEYSLIVCFPAGLALLVLPPLLFYLDCRCYRRVTGFALAGKDFTYTVSRDAVSIHRSSEDVCWVTNRMHRGRTTGYLIKFRDGGGIFVCRSLSNADELAGALKESAGN